MLIGLRLTQPQLISSSSQFAEQDTLYKKEREGEAWKNLSYGLAHLNPKTLEITAQTSKLSGESTAENGIYTSNKEPEEVCSFHFRTMV